MVLYGRFVPLRRSSAFVFHLVLTASLIYAELFQSPARLRLESLTLRTNGAATTSTQTNSTKRLSDATYAEASQKGLNLRCLMAKSVEQTQSYQVADFLIDWENAATEGWVDVSNDEVPFFKHYLDQTFAALGTSGDSLLHHSISHVEGGLIFDNPSDPSEEELDALAVNPQGNFESNGVWSDVAFAQWSWITNKETVEIVSQAVINKFGPSPTIGKWNTGRLSFVQGDEGFDSILGSPNGRGCAWFLISHKRTLGEKTITQIDVFTGVLAYTVVGTTYNEETVQASKLFLLFHVQDV
ncbi:hypothetical protein PG991_009239 [Apiospora marii]|uniref:Uncharacterized protein n=1 Tax=Apiospora marii TaxID=335849 RepID=A0ABR1RK61_9PEZI